MVTTESIRPQSMVRSHKPGNNENLIKGWKNTVINVKNSISSNINNNSHLISNHISILSSSLESLLKYIDFMNYQLSYFKINNSNLKTENNNLKNENNNLKNENNNLLHMNDSLAVGQFCVPITDATQCNICMLNTKSHAFIECGHLCVCAECAPKCDNKCPICRTVSCAIKIYQ